MDDSLENNYSKFEHKMYLQVLFFLGIYYICTTFSKFNYLKLCHLHFFMLTKKSHSGHLKVKPWSMVRFGKVKLLIFLVFGMVGKALGLNKCLRRCD